MTLIGTTIEDVIASGWTYQDEFGEDHRFHRGFNGTSWLELTLFKGDQKIHICRKRTKDETAFRTYYYGWCKSPERLKTLMEILEI